MPLFLSLVLLIRNIANTIDITAINAAVRKVRSYDSGDGNEAEILFVSDSINTVCLHMALICFNYDYLINNFKHALKYP